ncbi:MAG TPA: bifunctional glycosyltransferase/class I SAM-dependent methyltransferase [Kiritimatiellia bacterium]|nr:bifunctional glycosyltransferase/class I SAM-dependent methyltransferase [Kiritimatiellia bacterium]
MSSPPKVGIFIIAFNAASHIQKTLSRIAPETWDLVEEAFIVDDCSTDETVNLALEVSAAYPKLRVMRNRTNRRYGGNQKFGYQYAIDRGLDVVVMLHADGQYAPEELPRMIDPLIEGRADVVIGSRMIERENALKGGMPRYKYHGNIILTWIENRCSGMNLSEFHSGYRAYSTAFLRRIPFWQNSDEWHFDTQILLQAHAVEARIHEFPIPTYYGDEICHVNGIAYAANCIAEVGKFWLHRKGLMYGRNYDLKRDPTSHYTEKFDDPYSSHSQLWGWLSGQQLEGARILELGVGDASLTRKLHGAGAVVDGVEISPVAAEAARPYCRTVRTGDLNRIDDLGLDQDYDMVIAADVLEHLVDPEYVLSVLKRLVKTDGLILVSLPNFVNLYVRINVLLGRLPLHSKGILDRTHLHLYTLSSMGKMLVKTGWQLERRDVTNIPLILVFPFMSKGIFRIIPWMLRLFTRLLPGLLGYQGLFLARNPNRAELL